MASHAVGIERRTNGSFTPIGVNDAVRPGEAIRLSATGVGSQSFNEPDFIITRNSEVVFRQKAAANLGGVAFLDIASPGVEGSYVLTVHAQSVPFFPKTHTETLAFRVSARAPAPISAPPQGGFFQGLGQIKNFLVIGVVAIVVVGLISARR